MDINEINKVFDKGMEMMKSGNYSEAMTLFQKARNMTTEMRRK